MWHSVLQALAAKSQTTLSTYLKLGLLVCNNYAFVAVSNEWPDFSLPYLIPLTFGYAFRFCLLACCQRHGKGRVKGMIRLISTLTAESSLSCTNCCLVNAHLVNILFFGTNTISSVDQSTLAM